MSGWHDRQHEVRITTIYLLLLLSIPNSAADSKALLSTPNAATKWKRNYKVDIPRLYTAYRVLLQDGVGGGGNAKIEVGQIGKRIAVAEEDDESSISKTIIPLKRTSAVNNTEKASNLIKDLRAKEKGLSSIDYTNTEEAKYARVEKIKDVEDEKSGKEKSIENLPAAHGMVILKMDEPSKTKEAKAKKTYAAEIQQANIDEMENRLAKLNRVYQKYVNVWKRPTPETKGYTLLGNKNALSATNVRLSALDALADVVETLKQSNPVDEIVKAINDEMNPETESLVGSIKLNVNDYLAPSSQRGKNKIISDQSSNVVKRLVPKVAPDVKTGGLYEEYKKKLNDILQAHKNSHKALSEEQRLRAQSNAAVNANTLTQCHCDATKSVIIAVDSDGQTVTKEQMPCYCEATRPTNLAIDGDTVTISNGLIPCYCDSTKSDKLAEVFTDGQAGKTIVYMKVPESQTNGQQPSKESEMNGGLKPYYLSNSKHRQMVWNDVPLMRPGSAQKGNPAKQHILTVPKGECNQPVVCGKNSQESIPLRNNLTHSPSFTKNKNKLHHIIRVLQTKHRPEIERKTQKRGLNGRYDGMSANLAFPEVLVQKFGQPQETGGKLIENMAKQLNVSPVEMAQRIASSSGMGSGQPIATGMYPGQSPLASQTNGGQVPMMAPNLNNQQGQAGGNMAFVLEKILSRLQSMQDASSNQEATEKLPCCFAEPSDGSWESALLGIRINIRDDNKIVVADLKPTCMQPKVRRSDTNRLWRQCVKVTAAEIKDRFKSSSTALNRPLNITIQETVPPRQHEMLENLAEWIFTGRSISTLGGPMLVTCQNVYTNLIGTFVGFCRRCGCIDTIFGSWTFCHPSRDCQDITMSIFERRDVLRRYTLDDARKERLKEHLYRKSKKP
ncbi:uncharacterized protein Dmoj_GI22192, isoform B [Drosophila mojavensis]|uniref:Uncharacterized protein, isoform B n=1 Tax=Drosophila mojavensis TaxID=7230 RepID=B4K8C6_DROMO|nr:uncharacterized protein Dmoj_GI22192, isoform B [Drosophila mojavensis]